MRRNATRLDDTLTLATASRYANPLNPADKLPVVFGDFIDATTRLPQELGGCLPTVLIDTQHWIYLLSDSTIADEPIEVYAQQNTEFGELVPPDLYTILRTDVEGTGTVISAIQFISTGPSPTPYRISWRGKGSVYPPSILINDPVSMIQAMFTIRGNWLPTDFDAQSITQSIGIAAAYHIPVHWVFQEDQSYGQILTDVFENYLADISLNSDGQLRITYNLWPMVPINRNEIAQPYLDAKQDVAGDDPEDAVTYRLAQENLVNEVVIRARHNWVTNEQAVEYTFAEPRSQNAYHSRKVRNFTLKGIRILEHGTSWIQLFLSPLHEMPAIVTIPLKALLPYFHMHRGSFIALTWSAGPDVLGRGWDKRILRVLETPINYLEQTLGLRCFDTGLSVVPPSAVPFRAQNDSLWYLLVNPESGALQFVSTLPFPWISSGAERHWVTRVTPAGATIWVHPSNTGALTTALSQPGVGTGNSGVIDMVDWYFRHIDVVVDNTPTATPFHRWHPGSINLVPVPA